MKKLVNYDVVEMSESEKTEWAKDIEKMTEAKNKRLEAIEKKKKDKESANKKLKDLGLTDDEIIAITT
tara:strand:- start:51 stop:254 length:204 start_codon:yes stop_codon:yes gene_type:complete